MGTSPIVGGSAPIRIFASAKSWIEGNALRQLEQVAALSDIHSVRRPAGSPAGARHAGPVPARVAQAPAEQLVEAHDVLGLEHVAVASTSSVVGFRVLASSDQS